MSTLQVSTWGTPASEYPRRRVGRAQIVSWPVKPGFYSMYGVQGYNLAKVNRTVETTNLKIAGRVWMTDDFPHWYAMIEHARKFKGHVLCAGLGLGLIIHALADNPDVNKITVVERERDVINLVGPLVPKCEIIHGDFWKITDKLRGIKADGVFYDLFVGKGEELLTAAMRVWFDLHALFPGTTRRIHGFNNEHLESLDKLIERL